MDAGSLVVFAALTWSATDDPIATFRDALERARADYAPVLEANERRLLQGRMKEATQALLDVVAKDRRTAAHAFVLGNTLFDMEPELAMALHEEAYAKAPAIAPVAMEWALELHRAGRIPEAEALYRTLSDDASLGSSQNVIHALRAECLLLLDRPRDAVDSWRRVTLETIPDSTRVEKAACWIHFGPSSFARRDALLRAVDAGDVEAAEELILLDLNFKRDWWNSGIHHEYLKADLERMRASLPVDDLRVRQALAYADVRVSRDRSLEDMLASPKSAGLSADQQKLLATLRLIGDDAALPVSPRLTGEWMRMLVDAGVGDGAQMLERHGDELKRRGEAGDVIALETLAALYAMTDDPALADVDRMGFERTDSVRFAGSLLHAKQDTLRSDDPDLIAALARFPNDATITRYAAIAAQNGGSPATKEIAAHVAACFTEAFDAADLTSKFNLLESTLGDE